jgi:NADPH2:quinone reductase
MRAAVITSPGGPEVLEIQERPTPIPGPSEVLVRVYASALNRADLLQRAGNYPAPPGAPPDIPGMEFAGEVASLGPGASGWRAGDRVFGITGGGGHAEYLVAHEGTLARIPDSLSWTQAGAVPEVFITAHDAMVTQADVRAGETVLVHAVGSGVGLAAIQLARAWDAIPLGTARTTDKLERAREYGLAHGVAVRTDLEPMIAAIAEWTGGRGADVILDLVGGPYAEANVKAVAPKGRIMLIGTVAGRSGTFALGMILSKRLTIKGTMLRGRSVEEKVVVTRAFEEQVVPLLERGVVRPVIDRVFELDEIAKAHERLASNETFGKVVLRLY